MARKVPSQTVIKALFARSGNECAFPGCTQRLVNLKNQFIGQLCHIEAAEPGGERFNRNQDDDHRRGYENLILLCYPHHIETNDVEEFPVQRLSEIKRRHEQNFQKQTFDVTDEVVLKLVSEMESYWRRIEVLNTMEHDAPDLAINVNARASFSEIVVEIQKLVSDIEQVREYFDESDQKLLPDLLKFLEQHEIDTTWVESVPHYENPFINRNWEMLNLGLRNLIQELRMNLVHAEIRFLQEYLKVNRRDTAAISRMEDLKDSFKEMAQKAVHAD